MRFRRGSRKSNRSSRRRATIRRWTARLGGRRRPDEINCRFARRAQSPPRHRRGRSARCAQSRRRGIGCGGCGSARGTEQRPAQRYRRAGQSRRCARTLREGDSDEFAKRTAASGDSAARLVVAAEALRTAVERGDPFAPALAAVKALGANPNALVGSGAVCRFGRSECRLAGAGIVGADARDPAGFGHDAEPRAASSTGCRPMRKSSSA